jgi:hypothetical protein
MVYSHNETNGNRGPKIKSNLSAKRSTLKPLTPKQAQ